MNVAYIKRLKTGYETSVSVDCNVEVGDFLTIASNRYGSRVADHGERAIVLDTWKTGHIWDDGTPVESDCDCASCSH